MYQNTRKSDDITVEAMFRKVPEYLLFGGLLICLLLLWPLVEIVVRVQRWFDG